MKPFGIVTPRSRRHRLPKLHSVARLRYGFPRHILAPTISHRVWTGRGNGPDRLCIERLPDHRTLLFAFSVVAAIDPGPFFARHRGSIAGPPLFQLLDSHYNRVRRSTASEDIRRMSSALEALIGQLYLVTVIACWSGTTEETKLRATEPRTLRLSLVDYLRIRHLAQRTAPESF